MSPDISIIIPVYNVEKYIEQMLDSVKRQTFRNFEVIIVNDGSPDGSQKIIDRFCEDDDRFISFIKENGGVASARNFGLSKARGRFVVFYDPDDYIPSNALEKMYKTASSNDADIVVGVMSMARAGEYRVNGNTLKLSKKKIISKTDPDMLWSFSVCNKIFRRSMLEKYNIKFGKFKHAEDALFLFECVFKSKKIVGCPSVVYQYMIRPFWEEKSATQMINTSYLLDVIKALDSIELIISKVDSEEFLQAFYVRYCEVSLISGYYRQLWVGDNQALEILQNKISELRGRMKEGSWSAIKRRNPDLQLDKLLFTREGVIENALLSVIITENHAGDTRDNINELLQSLYDQCMPSFIIVIDESLKRYVKKTYLSMPNLFFVDDAGNIDISTEFVMYADFRILQSKNSLKMMVNSLLANEELDYVTAPIKVYRENELIYSIQETAFTVYQILKKVNRKRTKADRLDYMMGNKIFRTSSIKLYRASDFLYKELNFKKIINAAMIVHNDDSFIKKGCKNPPGKLYILGKMLQKKGEDCLIEFIKHHFTKDDIKRILKKDI